jgi:hypothetical protein
MKISPAVLQHRRAELEARIEEMIGLLDIIDGDENLEENGDDEQSLSSPGQYGNKKMEYDLEGDTSDDEHSLGWSNPMGLRVQIPAEASEMMAGVDGYEDGSTLSFDGDGHHIGRKLLRDHVKDRVKLAKALDRTRVSPGYGRYV